MRDYAAYFCGQWLPFSQVRIDPLDRGFLVGDCVFDVARTFNGKTLMSRRLRRAGSTRATSDLRTRQIIEVHR